MDVIQFIPQFLYRIRYRLLWGSLIVTALVIYFTQFLPFSYTVNSNIYAGVTNASSVTEERSDYFSTVHSIILSTSESPKALWRKSQCACLLLVWYMAMKVKTLPISLPNITDNCCRSHRKKC